MATLQEWRNSGLWERGALPPQQGKSQLFWRQQTVYSQVPMEKSTVCFPQWSSMDWIREMFHGYVRLLEGTWYRCAAPYAIFEVHFSRTAYAEDLLAYCKAGYLHLEVIKKEEKPSKKRIPLDSLHRKHWRFPWFAVNICQHVKETY